MRELACDARLIRAPDGTHPRSPPHQPGCPLASTQHGERRAECRPACALPQLTPLPQLIFSAFKTLTGQTVTVELKNDVALTGELKSVAFLMPCHSTPWQSHLHRQALETPQGSGEGGTAWFITCEPPASG